MLNIFGWIFVLGVFVLLAVVGLMWVQDVRQMHDAVRRNYPVIGRFRGLFITLGEFFRQYFFAMDREELPFNRAQREWVYRAAEAKGSTIAFYARQLIEQVEVIAHSCGVEEAVGFEQHHVRVVCPDGKTKRADQLHPRPEII